MNLNSQIEWNSNLRFKFVREERRKENIKEKEKET
jgi:hypothetical protein